MSEWQHQALSWLPTKQRIALLHSPCLVPGSRCIRTARANTIRSSEAHRFAITTHRAGRSKALVRSELDDVPGVGPALKRKLLNHFGSARGVRNAAFEDLANAAGIGPTVARKIYEHFHPGG
jgi:ERCC4-type nuclease